MSRRGLHVKHLKLNENMPVDFKTRTYFFKPSRPVGPPPKIDPLLVAMNHAQGRSTTLILDTNILVKMEKVVASGNKAADLKNKGLHNLVALLNRCPLESIYLSPGLALNEMPPALAEKSRNNFDVFCERHLPQFSDCPSAIQMRYIGKVTDYGFFDLDNEAQAVLAIAFSSLVYLQLLDRTPGLRPIEKFKRYLNILVAELDLVSAREVEIARYCFANPPATSKEIIALRKVIRRNFLQTKDERLPRSADQLLHIAFNGACDLSLILTANHGDSKTIEGRKQDCWIATGDSKLWKFGEAAPHILLDGEAGKFFHPPMLEEHSEDSYWAESAAAYFELASSRATRYQSKKLDVSGYPALARRAADFAHASFVDGT